jgi:hypothetical protein
VSGGVLDEFVLSAPGEVREADLLRALRAGGGADPHVWPTTALAMADGQTGALSLAARIAASPEELPLAVAELLRARIITGQASGSAEATPAAGANGTVLKIPTAWHGPITFFRPGEPFTPAESARAHRLAELAEILAHRPQPPNPQPPAEASPRELTTEDWNGAGRLPGPGLQQPEYP